MIEPEVAFYNLEQIIQLANDLLKSVIQNTIKKHPKEFQFLDEKSNALFLIFFTLAGIIIFLIAVSEKA